MSIVSICLPVPHDLLSKAKTEGLSDAELAELRELKSHAEQAFEELIAGLDLIADYLCLAQEGGIEDQHLNAASWLIKDFSALVERSDNLRHVAAECLDHCERRSAARILSE